MIIVRAHNFYQQAGGEDAVAAAEVALLQSRGHEIHRYCVHNDAVDKMGSAALAKATVWNRKSYDDLTTLLKTTNARIVHFDNTFPLISPSAYYAAKDHGAVVIQTLHNYRLLCCNAIFFRDGHVCEDCLGKSIPWPGVVHKCYRDSAKASALVAVTLTIHRAKRTYRDRVDRYIALNEFSRQKFVAGGLPAQKIIVKPNFVEDPGPGSGGGGYALFVGRLTTEKGVDVLLRAWANSPLPLKIAGDGPLKNDVLAAAAAHPSIEYLGRQTPDEVMNLMGAAEFLIFPSIWYEGQPRTLIESFAKGTPVLASRLGAMAEFIADHETGALFTPGDSTDLAARARDLTRDPSLPAQMRVRARAEFLNRYTADENYRQLISIYERTLSP